MATGLKWQSCRGSVLQNAVEAGESLKHYIAEGGGVYFWKARYRAEAWESSDAASMVAWLDRLTSGIHGRSTMTTISHVLQIPSVEIRGGGLNEEKRQYLLQFLKSAPARKWLADYIESLEKFSPTLYVGETGNLRRRASEHVRHLTDFGLYVQEASDLSWEFLDFYYLPLGGFESKPEKLRKSIEYVSAALTIAGLTKRPG